MVEVTIHDKTLLPCPFCGSDFKVSQEPHDNHPVNGLWYLFHAYGELGSSARRCLIDVPKYFDTKEEAIAAWNTRAPTALQSRIEALEAALRDAAKAERDRLRKLPDDVLLRAMDSFNNGLINKPDTSNPRGFVTYYDPLQASKNLVADLADALDGEDQ